MATPQFPGADMLRPPSDIRIEALTVTPYPDRVRIHIHIRVTPFQQRPNLLLVARDAHDRIVSELDIIETMHHDMEFTLHLRGLDDPTGAYTLVADLFYDTRNPPQDRRVEPFTVPAAD